MSKRKKHSPININDLGLSESIKKIERIANCLEEVHKLVLELKKEGIDIGIEIKLK